MKTSPPHPFLLRLPSLAAACAVLQLLAVPVMAQDPDDLPTQDGVEYLTRGPVHEAFSTVIVFRPEAGITVTKAPPEAVDEIPPDRRPEGDNVAWIPGYWSWDEEAADFIWISGIWRVVPPERQWVPGYWNDLGGQYQWTSGYWAPVAEAELTYLPEPPETLESGPNIPRPNTDSVWLPGYWSYGTDRYRWSPGYWEPARQDWVWVPPHYVWTPRGYVFVEGYWDYTVDRRGTLFSPVRFSRPVYSQPGYRYQPLLTIAVALLTEHLFVRPSSCHYYFGDYYEPRYRSAGYYSPFQYGRQSRGYDPIFAHQMWIHRSDTRYIHTREERFDYFCNNARERPPHTWNDYHRHRGDDRHKHGSFATPLARLTQAGPGRLIAALTDSDRRRFLGQSQAVKKVRTELQTISKGNGRPSQPIKLPTSPIASVPDRLSPPLPPKVKPRPIATTPDKGKPKGKGGFIDKPGPGPRPQQPGVPGVPSKEKPTGKSGNGKEVKPDPGPRPQPSGPNMKPPVRPSQPSVSPRPDSGKPKPKPTPSVKPGPTVKPSPKPVRPNPAVTPQRPKPQPSNSTVTPNKKPSSPPARVSKPAPPKPKPQVKPQTSKPKPPATKPQRPASASKGKSSSQDEDRKKKK